MTGTLPELLLAAAGGAVVALLYLGLLYASIQQALASERAGLWLLAGGPVRIVLVCLGLWAVAGGQGGRLVAAALGFTVARLLALAVERRRGGVGPAASAREEDA